MRELGALWVREWVGGGSGSCGLRDGKSGSTKHCVPRENMGFKKDTHRIVSFIKLSEAITSLVALGT